MNFVRLNTLLYHCDCSMWSIHKQYAIINRWDLWLYRVTGWLKPSPIFRFLTLLIQHLLFPFLPHLVFFILLVLIFFLSPHFQLTLLPTPMSVHGCSGRGVDLLHLCLWLSQLRERSHIVWESIGWDLLLFDTALAWYLCDSNIIIIWAVCSHYDLIHLKKIISLSQGRLSSSVNKVDLFGRGLILVIIDIQRQRFLWVYSRSAIHLITW